MYLAGKKMAGLVLSSSLRATERNEDLGITFATNTINRKSR